MNEDEFKLSAGDLGSRRLKAKAFEREMDRMNDSIKKAKSESDLAKRVKFKGYIMDKYNKYNWKNVHS